MRLTRRVRDLDSLEYLRHALVNRLDLRRNVPHRLSQPFLSKLYPSIDIIQQYAMIFICTSGRRGHTG